MQNKEHPYVVVLILSYNGKHLLEDSVSSYLKNEYPNFDVVVIDNGSTDGTKEYVEEYFPDAYVLRLEKNRGYSGGFNLGFEYAVNEKNADYVLVTNNDVKVDNNLINELVKVAQTDSQIGFVTGKVYFYNLGGKRNVIQTVGKKTNAISIIGDHIGCGEEDIGQYDNIEERDFCDDIFTLIRREVIEATEGYNELFFLDYEEADWQIRSKKLGYKIVYTPHAKIWHKVSATVGRFGDSPRRNFFSARSNVIFIKLHGTGLQFFMFFLLRLFFQLPSYILSCIVRGRVDLIISRLKGHLSGIIWILRK